MNNNSKNNTQTKMTIGERLNNFFNITTVERKNNISRYVHISFVLILVSLLVFVGVQKLSTPENEKHEVSIEENIVEEIQEPVVEEPKVMTVEMAVISYEGLFIRKEPSADSIVTGVLYYGNVVDIEDTDDEDTQWLKMSAGGYVNKNYLELYDPNKDYSFPEEFLAELRRQQEEAMRQQRQQQVRVSRGGEAPQIVSSNTYAYFNDCVKSSSGLTELDIYNILNEKAPNMASIASDVIDIERDYGINALFTISVASHESGWAKSELAMYNNNIFGLKDSANGGWYSFSSKSESAYLFARSIVNIYFSNGLYTPWDINEVYCPGDGGYWSGEVTKIMREYINAHNRRIG